MAIGARGAFNTHMRCGVAHGSDVKRGTIVVSETRHTHPGINIEQQRAAVESHITWRAVHARICDRTIDDACVNERTAINIRVRAASRIVWIARADRFFVNARLGKCCERDDEVNGFHVMPQSEIRICAPSDVSGMDVTATSCDGNNNHNSAPAIAPMPMPP